jgi:hypothetical protein
MAGTKFPARDLYLGELYFNSYRFDESVIAYQNFITTLKDDDPKLADYQQFVKRSEQAARLLTKVEDIAVVDSVVVNKNDFLRFYKYSNELGTLSQELLKTNTRKSIDKIKYTTQRGDRIFYSDSIHGQLDIFTSFKLLDGWSAPVSISEIVNTSANENYPFLLLDGVTIYFASDGENSIGGYDLFVTRYNSTTASYLTPENIGMPFNSPYNDYMMVIDEQRKLGWFATDRYQTAGKVVIYTFVPNETKIIIRSEDKEYIRKAAQMKSYRKQTKVLTDNSITTDVRLANSEKSIEFVVNDTLVYTHINQFKSVEALKIWTEWEKLSLDLKKNSAELDDLRLQYTHNENTEVRSKLSKRIIELEKLNPELERLMYNKLMQVRNLEAKYLQKAF